MVKKLKGYGYGLLCIMAYFFLAAGPAGAQTPPFICYALQFNGNSAGVGNGDYVQVPDPTGALNPAASSGGAMTLEAWVKWAGETGETNTGENPDLDVIVGKRRSIAGTGYFFDIRNGYVELRFLGSPPINTFASSTSQIPLNQWTHIACTYDAGTGQSTIYINGTLDATTQPAPAGTTILTSGLPLLIGREFVNSGEPYLEARAFNGRIDEVRIWNVVRTSAQIQADYNHSLTGSESGLLAYFDFNEGSGTIVHDKTGHGFDGTLGSPPYNPTWVLDDTTPPKVQASLVPQWGNSQHGEDHGEGDSGDGTRYQVAVSATDNCDPAPVVTALISQPLSATDTYSVRYRSNPEQNSINIKTGKKPEVELKGTDEAALRGLLNNAIAAGGFSVTNGQILKLVSKSSNGEKGDNRGEGGSYEYTFDAGLKLLSASGPTVQLIAVARDAAGNTSQPVEVVPPRRRASKPVALNAPEVGTGSAFSLENFPNPFNPATTIRYSLAEAANVRLVIYNVLGQQVRTLVNAAQTAGVYTVRWDGKDALGRGVTSGMYLYRLEAGPNVAVRKMILLK